MNEQQTFITSLTKDDQWLADLERLLEEVEHDDALDALYADVLPLERPLIMIRDEHGVGHELPAPF